MASEYKCDICGAPATVHITKIIDGKKAKIHLCSACAEKASLDAFGVYSEIFPKIKEIEEALVKEAKVSANGEYCPTCGAKLSDLEKGARFSCPDCYSALKPKLFGMLTQMHGAASHAGKTPKHHCPNSDISALQREEAEDISQQLKSPSTGEPPDIEEILEEADAELKKSALSAPPLSEGKTESDESESAENLRKKLEEAISEERYEDAAKLRDKLKSLSK